MRRLGPIAAAAIGVAVLAWACFGRALWDGEQLAYRDAGHFYYPLYERVEREWNAGRLPLWEPEENAGMPLLGNPTAAVLYPGKVIYRLLPYARAARVYAVAHVALACLAMVVLMRHWKVRWGGAMLAGLSYAFGVPILFQYCNIVFLVGAAWLPLGIRAIDRWLRQQRPWALLELAAVLALQTLGGDPQTAYVSGLCAGGYALLLARRPVGSSPKRRRRSLALKIALGFAIAAAWTAATIALAAVLPRFRGPRYPPVALPWMPYASPVVAAIWGVIALRMFWRLKRAGDPAGLIAKFAGLALAGSLAVMLTAAQLLPVFEFTSLTTRAAGGAPHDIYPFSLETARLLELVVPNAFGDNFSGSASWLGVVPTGNHREIWVPSLYMGVFALALAAATFRLKARRPERAWMSAIALVTLVASLGEFTGPLWWARWSPTIASLTAPHDPTEGVGIRLDGALRDGDGSFYWLLSILLPGFRQFRYPSKLLTFTVLGIAALAGLGWDGMSARARRRFGRVAISLLVVLALAAAGSFALRPHIFKTLELRNAARSTSIFGPSDPAGAFRLLILGIAQATIVVAAGWTLVRRARRRRSPFLDAGVVALVALDLACANSRYVLTIPQTLLEGKTRVAALIEAAERDHPSPGPFRIHRMPTWSPVAWLQTRSDRRGSEIVDWERQTLQPKYGINEGVEYTQTIGTAELFDYLFFFAGFNRTMTPGLARLLNATPGQQFVYFPRRSYDMWNTRYFVLPYVPNHWNDEDRGFASFLADTERIYPPADALQSPQDEKAERDWAENSDFQIRRNRTVYPRAWVVHQGLFLPDLVGLDREARQGPIMEILYASDGLWMDPERIAYDPKSLAWFETGDARVLQPFLPGSAPIASETATFTRRDPQRVELDVALERPGVLVLADVYYPGWKLTDNGAPATIHRANRMMRGAALSAGPHHLIYTYEPNSFRIGALISIAGLAICAAAGVVLTLRALATRTKRPGAGT